MVSLVGTAARQGHSTTAIAKRFGTRYSTTHVDEILNADALSDAMKLLIDDRKLRERLGDAARKDAVANHTSATWARHIGRTMSAIGELTQ